jgi:4-amino-4-deoxy-L-arabinose transferase-like glycosyltransferase
MVRGRRELVLCAALALGVGLAMRLWFVAHAARIEGDTFVYGNIARNWIQHGVYGYVTTEKAILPTLIRLPGYPTFLAACFAVFGPDQYIAVMCVQCVIDLLACLLLAALANLLFGRRAALAALLLSTLCPFTATYAATPLTETLTVATVALTFYGLHRWRIAGLGFNRWLWITAEAMAYSVLLRPEQGLLAAAVVPAMLWMAIHSPKQSRQPGEPSNLLRAVSPVILATLVVVLPLAPWTLRNWRTFHVFQPLAPRSAADPGEFVPAGFYRWYRTWAIDFASTEEVYWNYDNAPVETRDLPTRAFDTDDQYALTDALLDDYNRNFQPTPQNDARFEELAEKRIHADPLRYYVALPVARLLNMALRPRTEMFSTSLEWWKGSEHPGQTVFAVAYGALNLAYLILGGIGLWLWHRRGWGKNTPLAWAMLATVLLRCALLLTLDNSEPRYTLEFFPLLVLWGSSVFATGKLSLQSQTSTQHAQQKNS